MSKKGPRGLQNMGSMQKNGFQIDFRRNYECLKFEYFWSKFSNVHKGPQRSLEHGINVEKWFLDRFSAKLRMSLIRKILGQNFRMSKKGPRGPQNMGSMQKNGFQIDFRRNYECLKFEYFWSKFSNVPQRAPEVPRTWDRCRKMVFRSIFGEITNVFNSKNFGQNFRMSKKGPRGPQNMGSMQKNGFQIDFRRNYECLKFEKILVKIFECPIRALEVPRTWDRCRKMVFRSIFDEVTNV